MSTHVVELEGREYTLVLAEDHTLTDISYVDGNGRRRPLSVNGKVAKLALELALLQEPPAVEPVPFPDTAVMEGEDNGTIALEREEAIAREDMLEPERQHVSAKTAPALTPEQIEAMRQRAQDTKIGELICAVEETTIVDEAPEVAFGGAAGGGKPPHPSFMARVKRAWGLARAINTTNALMKSGPKNAVELRELLGVGNPQYEVPKFRYPTPERVPMGDRIKKVAGSYGKGLKNHFARKRLEARNG